MTVFGVILFGCLVLELWHDWSSRGKDYVIASQFNYVVNALIYMALIVAAGVYPLLSRGNLMALLAIPLVAICASLVSLKHRGIPLSPLFVLLIVFPPFMLLAKAICDLVQPTSTKSR